MNCPIKALDSQAKEIVAHVYRVCSEEASNNAFKIPLKAKLERAAMYTGVSRGTVNKIRREDDERTKSGVFKPLSAPSKKRRRMGIKDTFNNVEFSMIRHVIEKIYIELKIVPTLKTLLKEVQKEIAFPYSTETLRRLLKANGFYWSKSRNKRISLVESPHIVHWRYTYLKSVKKYREEGRTIVYIDEAFLDKDQTFKKCWQSSVLFDDSINRPTGRFNVVHAGSENGFVPDAWLIFESGLSSGEYQGEMNKENFMKWLVEKLIPNLPEHSVIVMDPAPYHSVQEFTPSRSSTKTEIISWLSEKCIPHDPSQRKFDLFDLVLQHGPAESEPVYVVDNVIKSYGHIPLRIPPHMCDLNPLELVWAHLQTYVRTHNTTGTVCVQALMDITEKGIASITPGDWKIFSGKVVAIEDHYWNTDELLEEIEPQINAVVQIGSDSDTCNSEDEENGEIKQEVIDLEIKEEWPDSDICNYDDEGNREIKQEFIDYGIKQECPKF